MHLPKNIDTKNSMRNTIRKYYRADEDMVVKELLPLAELCSSVQIKVDTKAVELAKQVRCTAQKSGNIQNLLNQYALSTDEGIVLMCLAEALLRVPDSTTADRLIRDKLLTGNWSSHIGSSESFFVNASSWGLLLSGEVVSFNKEDQEIHINNLKKSIGKLGEPVIRIAMRQAMGIMGTQFVLGRTIKEAGSRAKKKEVEGYRYSFDMLGEAARTMEDADIYFNAYKEAIKHIGESSRNQNVYDGAGISVKLSAIHPRYEFIKSDRLMEELVNRLKDLAVMAKERNLGFTIDAEEADRLDISLDIIEAIFTDPDLDDWQGFGMVVQAYQKRALHVLNWAIELSQKNNKKMMIRLVKGAYWDSEIKIAQVDGLSGYPVFTRKASTDINYQACASLLLNNRNTIFPQFATHNAYSVAYILERAGEDLTGFEFQRLHGMGEGLYDEIMTEQSIPVRIYAPVGEHKSLLAYLVRRLLENGANSSFVNNIVDESISLKELVEDPVKKIQSWSQITNPNIPLPIDIYGSNRRNSAGIDLTDVDRIQELSKTIMAWEKDNIIDNLVTPQNSISSCNPTNNKEVLGFVRRTSIEQLENKLDAANQAYKDWSSISIKQRSDCLKLFGDKLEQHMDEFIALCTKEAGKIAIDGVAEVREAVDFCRYYADQGEKVFSAHADWEKDGELESRGVVLCISPWNFPLAIFIGQITAALAAGNSVLAKPADSTCLIASRAVELMMECGFPENVVQLILTPGKVVGENLLPDERISAVMFTGSTGVGKWISQKLAERTGPRIPLIAETGGQNCLIVDSTALPEQVVDDVISSGFQSAGQRCSALRVLFLQDDIAEEIIQMIIGGMKELQVGDPANLRTDIGPVIDQKALSALKSHSEFMQNNGRLLYKCELSNECSNGTFFAPHLYEIENIGILKQEVFGPVIHVVRYKADELNQALADINSTGFGLTSGVHSRVQTTSEKVIKTINAGNIYINRNTIGAVVGVQPFGGQGLSGTGPKAGGPSYVYRLAQQKLIKHNQKLENELDFNFSNIKPEQEIGKGIMPSLLTEKHKQLHNHISSRLKKVKAFIDLLLNDNSLELPNNFINQIDLMINDVITHQIEPLTLQGPTGELNQLILQERGSLICIHQGDENFVDSLRQILAALLTGNSIIHISNSDYDFSNHINDSNLNLVYQRVAINDESYLQDCLSSEHLAGIAASVSDPLLQWLDRVLSQREGSILPLILENSGPTLMQRFVLEKSVSTNTTASGGNTTLLAMADE